MGARRHPASSLALPSYARCDLTQSIAQPRQGYTNPAKVPHGAHWPVWAEAPNRIKKEKERHPDRARVPCHMPYRHALTRCMCYDPPGVLCPSECALTQQV